MTYSELKGWLENWIEEIPDRPIPLDVDICTMSRDIRFPIKITIGRIEAIDESERKKSVIADAYKNNLIAIKKAIDEKKFDITRWGYSDEYSTFKQDDEGLEEECEWEWLK